MRIDGRTFGDAVDAKTWLGKSQLDEDLFNHRPLKTQERKKRPNVQVSNVAKVLDHRQKQALADLLSKDTKLSKALDEIPLLGQAQGTAEQLRIRKFNVYMRWSSLETNDSQSSEADAPFLTLKNTDKEGKLMALAQESELAQQELLRQKEMHIPNYYYLVYSHAYSFN